ncbi:hypothetical protein [Neokomagataea anthophila]|uniref:Uncharacterized protein n=1 Tax=Neokomagataea anthophila TaxID=2826925 RepID=A0ABS5E7C2_9PROT|nr:hypothetical protein [Neokomagataea anthophila]MBR0559803.1 hypothetical protein [Neokomagataea anthophila]
MIKQGVARRVLVLGPIGLLWLGTWAGALVAAAIDLLVLRFCPAPYMWFLLCANHLTFAVFFPELRQWELTKLAGYNHYEGDMIIAPNHNQALLRILDRQVLTDTPPELPCVLS